MRTNYRLMSRITDLNNLKAAWKHVYGKDAAGGIDNQSVQDFAKDLEKNLKELKEDLLDGSYVPRPLKSIKIDKPNKPGEKRELSLPAVRDKVAQEAVRRCIEPFLNKQFSDRSYGYRPNKGPQKAIKRTLHILKTCKISWIIVADIDDFFPSIDHEILIKILQKYKIEQPVIHLLLLWLKMGTVDSRNRWHDVYHGIRQGGIISPLLANVYLNELDQFLDQKKVEFIRYADDIRFFCTVRQDAEIRLQQIRDFLANNLKLKLNDMPEYIYSIEKGFSFLGFWFQKDQLSIATEKIEGIENKIKALIYNKNLNWRQKVNKLNNTYGGWERYYGVFIENIQDNLLLIFQNVLIEMFTNDFFKKREGRFKEFKKAWDELPFASLNRDKKESFIKNVAAIARQKAREKHDAQKSIQQVEKRVRQQKREFVRNIVNVAHLLVTSPGSFIGKNKNRVYVRKDKKIVYEVPLRQLESITLLHHGIALSTDVIIYSARNGVPICWLTPPMGIEAVIMSPDSRNARLQLQQLRFIEDVKRKFHIARQIVLAKVKNQINLIKYFSKYEKAKNSEYLAAYNNFLEEGKKLTGDIKDMCIDGDWSLVRDRLFNLEGRMAGFYWKMVGRLLPEEIKFNGRVRQGAKDLVNSMLNYGYAMLRSKVLLALYRVALNPYLSFLHVPRSGKDTLTFDLMELFRAQAVDRVVIGELRRHHKQFKVNGKGELDKATRNRLIEKINIRFGTIERFRQKEYKLEEIIQNQAMELRQHIEGKGKFRPYVGKW